MKYFIYAIILIVAVAVIAGFFIIGSPQEERLKRFDDRRVQDLQSLQGEIIYYWQNKGELPENLGILENETRGFKVFKDPESSSDYDYKIKGKLSFELCADFSLPSEHFGDNGNVTMPASPSKLNYSGPESWNWEHQAGLSCFERIIDPDFYKKPISI
jgi:hypothetical protein